MESKQDEDREIRCRKPSVEKLLAASKQASWHGAPEGVKLLLAVVEVLVEDVTAQGALLHALTARSVPMRPAEKHEAHTQETFTHSMKDTSMPQNSGVGTAEKAQWRRESRASADGDCTTFPDHTGSVRHDHTNEQETGMPTMMMMMMMMHGRLKAERAMRGDPTDGPRKN